MGINWWQVFALSAMAVIVGFFILLYLSYLWDKNHPREPQEDAEPRLPEIGDEYRILDLVWVVRSREAVEDKGGVPEYWLDIRVKPNQDLGDYHSTKRRTVTLKFLENFQFLGNQVKDTPSVPEMVGKISRNHGVSTEEINIALDTTLTGHAETDEKNRSTYDQGLPLSDVFRAEKEEEE